jgi:hypothetical protein
MAEQQNVGTLALVAIGAPSLSRIFAIPRGWAYMNDARQLATPDELVDDPAISFGEIFRFAIRALKARFRDHSAELSVIKRHIRRGDIVCDVGANKGSFVYWLSRWAGKSGRVVAFEPQKAPAR